MDRRQWISLTATDEEAPSCVYLRLLKVSNAQRFNLAYSKRMLAVDRRLVLKLVTFQVIIERLQKELKDSRLKLQGQRKIAKLENTMRSMRSEQQRIRRRRVSQRFLLMAVRYHLIDPRGLLFDEDETYLEAVRNRKPIRRSQSVVSGSVTDGRSQSPQPTDAVTSRQAPRAASDSHTIRSGASNDAQAFTKARTGVPNTRDLGDRDAVLAQQVIQRMKTPGRRTGDPKSLADSDAGSPIHVGQDAVQEINARFQPPRRSTTSQSLIPSRPPSPTLQRSRTLGLDADLEAQTRTRRKSKKISFAPVPLDRLILPVFTISGGATHPSSRILDASPLQGEPPYIFRRHTGLKDGSSLGSIAITPHRIPPAHRVAKQLTRSQECASSPSEAQHGPSQLSGVLSRLEAHRKEKDMKRLQPFFEWRAPVTTPSTPRTSDIDHATLDVHVEDGSPFPSPDHDSTGSMAGTTLDILHSEMLQPYRASEDFAIQPRHYIDVEDTAFSDVTRYLEDQAPRLISHSRSDHPSEEQRFWETKMSILTRVDMIISCFIGNNELPNLILKKIWGLLFQICQVTLGEVSMQNLE